MTVGSLRSSSGLTTAASSANSAQQAADASPSAIGAVERDHVCRDYARSVHVDELVGPAHGTAWMGSSVQRGLGRMKGFRRDRLPSSPTQPSVERLGRARLARPHVDLLVYCLPDVG